MVIGILFRLVHKVLPGVLFDLLELGIGELEDLGTGLLEESERLDVSGLIPAADIGYVGLSRFFDDHLQVRRELRPDTLVDHHAEGGGGLMPTGSDVVLGHLSEAHLPVD